MEQEPKYHSTDHRLTCVEAHAFRVDDLLQRIETRLDQWDETTTTLHTIDDSATGDTERPRRPDRFDWLEARLDRLEKDLNLPPLRIDPDTGTFFMDLSRTSPA